MDIPQSAMVTALVVALVQVIKFAEDKNWKSLITILAAILIGAGAGAFGVEGLNIVSGILSGLAAVGAVTVATKIGGN